MQSDQKFIDRSWSTKVESKQDAVHVQMLQSDFFLRWPPSQSGNEIARRTRYELPRLAKIEKTPIGESDCVDVSSGYNMRRVHINATAVMILPLQ